MNIHLLEYKISRFDLSIQKKKIEIIMKLIFSKIINNIYIILEEFDYYYFFIEIYMIIIESFINDFEFIDEKK